MLNKIKKFFQPVFQSIVINKTLVTLITLITLMFTVSNCKSDNDDSDEPRATVNGTVAIGDRVFNASVVASCGSAERFTGRTGDDGSYSLGISGQEAIDECRENGIRLMSRFTAEGKDTTLFSGMRPSASDSDNLMVNVNTFSDVAVRQSVGESIDFLNASQVSEVDWTTIIANVVEIAKAVGIPNINPIETFNVDVDNQIEVWNISSNSSGIMFGLIGDGSPPALLTVNNDGEIQPPDAANAAAFDTLQMATATLIAELEAFADRLIGNTDFELPGLKELLPPGINIPDLDIDDDQEDGIDIDIDIDIGDEGDNDND